MTRRFHRLCGLVAAGALCLAVVTPLAGRSHCRAGDGVADHAEGHDHGPAPSLPAAPPESPEAGCPHCPPVQCAAQAACFSLLLDALPRASVAVLSSLHAAPAQGSVSTGPARFLEPPTHPPSLSVATR